MWLFIVSLFTSFCGTIYLSQRKGMIIVSFGDRLKKLRLERKLNQSDCADIFSLSSSAIGSYERNEREPSYSHLVQFADYYKVSLDYLLCRTDERLTVADYITQKNYELDDILNTHDITVKGYELSAVDKKSLSDVSIGLFWKNFN